MQGEPGSAGQILAGKYRLVQQLGRGGMGCVWRAEHLTLASPVAIKLLHPWIAHSPDARARFLGEARAAAALRSPHVVQILDFGVHEDVPFIAMELLEGEPLSARLARQGWLGLAETALVVQHVARALSKAHAAGVVHRDLKPENVFLISNAEEEIAKVLDFGIAKAGGDGLGAGSSAETRTGAVLGTPHYMSPEQARGAKDVDYRSDLWSLGVIAFVCLTGRRPFESDVLGDLLMKICGDPIPVPSQLASVPPGFDAWFARATSRDKAQRFQSAEELAGTLRTLLTGAPASHPVPSAAPTLGSATPASYAAPHAPIVHAVTAQGNTQEAFGMSQAPPQRGSALPLLLLGGLVAFGLAAGGAGLYVYSQTGSTAPSAAAAAPSAQPAAPAEASPAPTATTSAASSNTATVSPTTKSKVAGGGTTATPTGTASGIPSNTDLAKTIADAKKAQADAERARIDAEKAKKDALNSLPK